MEVAFCILCILMHVDNNGKTKFEMGKQNIQAKKDLLITKQSRKASLFCFRDLFGTSVCLLRF